MSNMLQAEWVGRSLTQAKCQLQLSQGEILALFTAGHIAAFAYFMIRAGSSISHEHVSTALYLTIPFTICKLHLIL